MHGNKHCTRQATDELQIRRLKSLQSKNPERKVEMEKEEEKEQDGCIDKDRKQETRKEGNVI